MRAVKPPSQQLVRVCRATFLIAVLAGCAIAAQRTWRFVKSSGPPAPVFFDRGLSPVRADGPKQWTNQFCGSCHQDAYRSWKDSRHAIAGTEENFRLETLSPLGGRQQFCINCHAPRNPGHDILPTALPENLETLFDTRPAWLADGVDCLTCHVRDGHVLSTATSEAAERAHPMRVAPELGKAEFCAGCHNFNFKTKELPDSFHGGFHQASLDEFLEFRSADGQVHSCQECHMPGGDHRMPGGHSDSMRKQAVDLEVESRWRDDVQMVEITVAISAQNIGHRLPGGEHHRFLTLRTKVIDEQGRVVQPEGERAAAEPAKPTEGATPASGSARSPPIQVIRQWPQIESMRRRMEAYERGDPNAQPIEDTRLWPGERRLYTYLVALERQPARSLKVRAEVWYHLMSDEKAELFDHKLEDLQWLVQGQEAELALPPSPSASGS